jgi:2-polyprenyl-3-methyl-5-hydroxy-6-metoxy-1,4-benzoquinol methylase
VSDLAAHLERYGIKHFPDDDAYWKWGGTALDLKTARQIERYMWAHADGKVTPSQTRRFYDLIATPAVASVVHSQKADAIRASGQAVADRIGSARRVLDLGCGLGYLTTYYAIVNPSRRVLGCDASQKTMHHADVLAKKFGIPNVEFLHWKANEPLPAGPWDAVVSTQFFSELNSHDTLLGDIASQLADDGMIVSVDAFGTQVAAEHFRAAAAENGLRLSRFGFCRFSDLGTFRVYPIMVLTPGVGPAGPSFDLGREWESMLAEIAEIED